MNLTSTRGYGFNVFSVIMRWINRYLVDMLSHRSGILFGHNFSLILRRSNSNVANVGKRIKSQQELDEFFTKSVWSTSELLTEEKMPVQVTDGMLDGLLDLSGLSKSIPLTERAEVIKSLIQQLNFITKLHNIPVRHTETPLLTRLVDDKSIEAMTFDNLMSNISSNRQDLSKGEIENSWNPLSLASEHQHRYFLVKEGLLKKNK